MKQKLIGLYRTTTLEVSKLSHCNRKKVGAILVKDNRIISIGYNGTPSGMNNSCEDESGQTKNTVIHAEMNAIAKIARSNDSSEGSTLFVTLSPCVECAKMIFQSGISSVYYLEDYRSSDGIEFLKNLDVEVVKI